MPTYSYTHCRITMDTDETLEQICPDYKMGDFEIVQSIKDEALQDCPCCELPVKRIITTAPGYKFNGTGFTPKFHG